jgi:Ca2+-dependent lipid-binding protein
MINMRLGFLKYLIVETGFSMMIPFLCMVGVAYLYRDYMKEQKRNGVLIKSKENWTEAIIYKVN